jgi:hypothetical protein
MLTIMKRKGDRPEDIGSEKRLLRQRSKKMIEDLKQSYTMTTEARYANGHIEYRPDIAPKPMTGRMDPLPKWHRWALFASRCATLLRINLQCATLLHINLQIFRFTCIQNRNAYVYYSRYA